MSLTKHFSNRRAQARNVLTLEDYLKAWDSDKQISANTAGRIMNAIGEPEVFDTSKDERFGRIFSNRTIKRYAAFSGALGLEDTVSTIVDYFARAAQGAQQKRKILYFYGPPGSGKTEQIVEPLKRLAEKEPMFVLAVKEGDEYVTSPFFESPLGLFDPVTDGAFLEETYKIPKSVLEAPLSLWAYSWREKFGGDISKFFVKPVMPSMVTRTGIAQIVPGSPKHPDLSALIGVAGRKSDFSDYNPTGALNRTTQGLAEFFEMFKAHHGMFTPLLAAPQDRKYAGDGGVGELPYQGIVIAHSNEEEWRAFRDEKINPALLDRILDIPVPYCVRVTEVAEIYRRHMNASGYKDIRCPENTLELAAMFAVMTRMDYTSDARIDLYNGHRRGTSINADKRADDARREEKGREGMAGISERLMLTLLPQIADSNTDGPALDPVLVLDALRLIPEKGGVETYLQVQYFDSDERNCEDYNVEDIIENHIVRTCYGIVERLIKRAFTENPDTFVLAAAEHYVRCADAWIEGEDLKDPESGTISNRDQIEAMLSKFETGVSNPKDFRFAIAKAALRHNSKSENQGVPVWKSFDEETWKTLYENIVPTRAKMLEVIQFMPREDKESIQKHQEFVQRFCALGCTPAQVRRMVDFYCVEGKHLDS